MKHPFHLIDLVTLKKVASLFAGNYRTSFQGSGMEFSDIREYTIGDATSDIDWKTTARTGKVFIKKYEEDRERKVLFVVDMGASMRFGSGSRTKFDTLSELFSILSFSSVENGDPMGTWLFSDCILTSGEVKKGTAHLGRIRALFDRFRMIESPVESTLIVPIEELARRAIKNHLVFIFTDSLDLPNEQKLRALGAQNDMVFVHVFDTFENTLEASYMVHIVTTKKDLYIDASDALKKKEYRDRRSEAIEAFRKKLQKLGWSYLALDESKNTYRMLYDFFKGRQGR